MEASELRKKRREYYIKYFRQFQSKTQKDKKTERDLKFSFGQGFQNRLNDDRSSRQKPNVEESEDQEFRASENMVRRKKHLEGNFYSNRRETQFEVELISNF